jgi:hypothetical protein
VHQVISVLLVIGSILVPLSIGCIALAQQSQPLGQFYAGASEHRDKGAPSPKGTVSFFRSTGLARISLRREQLLERSPQEIADA